MRRLRLISVFALGFLLAGPVPGWALSPSPTPTPGSPLGGGGIGSVIAILVLGGLVALLIFYRKRVLEPFTQRYSNPPPEVPPGPRDRRWNEPDGEDGHEPEDREDRPTP